jgi:hypothetical protein
LPHHAPQKLSPHPPKALTLSTKSSHQKSHKPLIYIENSYRIDLKALSEGLLFLASAKEVEKIGLPKPHSVLRKMEVFQKIKKL